ncbi:Rhomboid-related protein 3 [Pseudolycoriella hygida]|uniref:Rhomboid-related protein 3 n=1 Tax=Pseudolycoriella hygida TaxID=35572 RepID=A0A9Q0S1S8_9DIPT|nr:Rhomboid-related protein 3 [Pseudolycoriella hygida]
MFVLVQCKGQICNKNKLTTKRTMVINRSTETDEAPPRKFRTLLRQNSERIGNFAEEIVLPVNQRSLHRMNSIGIALRNMQPDVETDGLEENLNQELPPTQYFFPVFMLGITTLQFCFLYAFTYIYPYGMSDLAYDPKHRYQVYRYLTIMFVHSSLPYLWLMVLIQLLLGLPLELIHNYTRIGVIYVASVVGGSLFITLFSPHNYVEGASAAAYGLLFSHLSTFILNWKNMDRRVLRVAVLLMVIIADVTYNIFVSSNHLDVRSTGPFTRVMFSTELRKIYHSVWSEHLIPENCPSSNCAYRLGGAITGFLFSIVVLKTYETTDWKLQLKFGCFVIITGFVVAATIVNIVNASTSLEYQNTFNNFTSQPLSLNV